MCKFQSSTPVLAFVVYDDGELKRFPTRDEKSAQQWIDNQIHTYGSHVVCTDIVPNIVELQI